MSIDFDGVDDVVTLATVTTGAAKSFSAWFFADTEGEVGGVGDGTITGQSTFNNLLGFDGSGTKKLQFRSDRATDGVWVMTSGMTTLAEWHFVCVTYDSTSTSNDPIMYLSQAGVLSTLTVGSGLTETSTPSGAETGDGGTWAVGSRASDGTQAFDGRIGEYAMWTRVLSAADVSALFAMGVQTLAGAYLYWPMDRQPTVQATDFSGNARNGTLGGSPVVGDNPPIRAVSRQG